METVLIIGASRLGASIASYCSQTGINAIIVDKDKESFKKVDPSFSGFFVEGNATSLPLLKRAGLEKAKEVNVVTGDDNTNIFLACLIERFSKVPYINVRLTDPQKEVLLPHERVRLISPSSLAFDLYKNLREKER
jgi:K+ transport systems, NAD-binding component